MALKRQKDVGTKVIKKSSRNNVGKWVIRRTKSEILICASCRGKYLKTRKNQEMCIQCMYRPEFAQA